MNTVTDFTSTDKGENLKTKLNLQLCNELSVLRKMDFYSSSILVLGDTKMIKKLSLISMKVHATQLCMYFTCFVEHEMNFGSKSSG